LSSFGLSLCSFNAQTPSKLKLDKLVLVTFDIHL